MPQHVHAAHRSRYLRCRPASRTGIVELRCTALDAQHAEVQVDDALTALDAAGERALEAYQGERFAAMIDGWERAIAARLESLLSAAIR